MWILIVILILIIFILSNKKENLYYNRRNYNDRRFIPITVTVPLQLPILIGVWQVLLNDAFAGYIKVDRVPGTSDEYQGRHYNLTMRDVGNSSFKFRVLDHTNILVMNPSDNIDSFTATIRSRNPITFGGMSYNFVFARIS